MYTSDRWYLATTPSAEIYFSKNVEKRTKEISELLLKKDIQASHQGILRFLSRYKLVRKKGGGYTAKNRLIKSTGKNMLCCMDRLIYITYRLFNVERTVNLHRLIYRLNAPCHFPHIACSCNGKIAFFN